MDIQVIESHHNDRGVEWGISFNGYNPNAEDYFEVINKQTAFRLKKKLLTEFVPIQFVVTKPLVNQ